MHGSDCLTVDAFVVRRHANGCVDLRFDPPAACAGCAGTCLWKRLQSSSMSHVQARGSFAAGSRVRVSLPERRLLHASLLIHGVPLLSIMLGAALGAAVTGNDAGTLAGLLAGVAFGLVICRPLRRRLEAATIQKLEIHHGV